MIASGRNCEIDLINCSAPAAPTYIAQANRSRGEERVRGAKSEVASKPVVAKQEPAKAAAKQVAAAKVSEGAHQAFKDLIKGAVVTARFGPAFLP